MCLRSSTYTYAHTHTHTHRMTFPKVLDLNTFIDPADMVSTQLNNYTHYTATLPVTYCPPLSHYSYITHGRGEGRTGNETIQYSIPLILMLMVLI